MKLKKILVSAIIVCGCGFLANLNSSTLAMDNQAPKKVPTNKSISQIPQVPAGKNVFQVPINKNTPQFQTNQNKRQVPANKNKNTSHVPIDTTNDDILKDPICNILGDIYSNNSHFKNMNKINFINDNNTTLYVDNQKAGENVKDVYEKSIDVKLLDKLIKTKK